MNIFNNFNYYLSIFNPEQLGMFVILTNYLMEEQIERLMVNDYDFSVGKFGYLEFEEIGVFSILKSENKIKVKNNEMFFGYLKELGFDSSENMTVDRAMIYEDIFNTWNNEKIIVHKKLSGDMIKAINIAMKKYTYEKVKECICRYSEVFKSNDYAFSWRWTLKEFLSQSNALPTFMDDGSKWVNFQDSAKKYVKKSQTEGAMDAHNQIVALIKLGQI